MTTTVSIALCVCTALRLLGDIAACVVSVFQKPLAIKCQHLLQVNTPYGSKVMSNATGVLLNNEMGGTQLLCRLLDLLHLNCAMHAIVSRCLWTAIPAMYCCHVHRLFNAGAARCVQPAASTGQLHPARQEAAVVDVSAEHLSIVNLRTACRSTTAVYQKLWVASSQDTEQHVDFML